MQTLGLRSLTSLLDGGFLDLYTSPRPSTPDDPVPQGAIRLASLRLGAPAFKLPIDGVAHANPIDPDSDASGSGNASWYRLWRADHATAMFDGSVGVPPQEGEETPDLVLPNVTILSHVEIVITRFILASAGRRLR